MWASARDCWRSVNGWCSVWWVDASLRVRLTHVDASCTLAGLALSATGGLRHYIAPAGARWEGCGLCRVHDAETVASVLLSRCTLLLHRTDGWFRATPSANIVCWAIDGQRRVMPLDIGSLAAVERGGEMRIATPWHRAVPLWRLSGRGGSSLTTDKMAPAVERAALKHGGDAPCTQRVQHGRAGMLQAMDV